MRTYIHLHNSTPTGQQRKTMEPLYFKGGFEEMGAERRKGFIIAAGFELL